MNKENGESRSRTGFIRLLGAVRFLDSETRNDSLLKWSHIGVFPRRLQEGLLGQEEREK